MFSHKGYVLCDENSRGNNVNRDDGEGDLQDSNYCDFTDLEISC